MVAVGLLAFWLWRPKPANTADDSDPRLTYPTPYLNVRPDVRYVGDHDCAECHAEVAARYSKHSMARAFAQRLDATPIERYEPANFNQFIAHGLHYSVGGGFHSERAEDTDGKDIVETIAPINFVVGSGKRGRAYLIENREGYLFQSPITWYPQAGRWDLSPGYDSRNQHFNRPITPGCLFCHADFADHVPGTANRYRGPIPGRGIGCERCHGPGELHVALRRKGEDPGAVDHTIVNPARLEHSLREAVCQQCHLQGEPRVLARGRATFDFRPGLPLHLFMMDFVFSGADHDLKFVSTVEQMHASRCFRASAKPRKLGCTSCHDPHSLPEPTAKVAYYRGRCLQCHGETSCSLTPAARRELNPQDSCIACHMPATGSEISHTSITDHRVPRRPEPGQRKPGPRPPPNPAALAPFLRDPGASEDDVARNLGVALLGIQGLDPPVEVVRRFADRALPLLDAALERHSDDAEAWKAKGDALRSHERWERALDAYRRALDEEPDREDALEAAARATMALDRLEDTRSYLERASRVNPWNWRYPHGLAVVSWRKGEWERALSECRRSLTLSPFDSTARRKLAVECLVRLGRKEQAQAEFDTLLRLSPEDKRPELRGWYEKLRP